MMPRVVIDTTILVSANLKPRGLEAMVVALVLNCQRTLCVCSRILAEYRAVLYRPKFRFDREEIDRFMALIETVSEHKEPSRTLDLCADPADNVFLECAEAGEARYLVTGNKRHFPAGWEHIQVVSAREFLWLTMPQRP